MYITYLNKARHWFKGPPRDEENDKRQEMEMTNLQYF